MIQQLLNHRTIRRYTDQPVASSTLNAILEAGIRAANTGNMQAYAVVVTQNSEQKKALAPAHFNQPCAAQAPAVLTFCVDFNRIELWCAQRNATPGFRNLQSFMAGATDAILVAQNVALAAESMGMGTCYLGTTTYNPHQIVDILQLPRGVFPVTTLTIGYPAEAPSKTDRLPLEAILHHETYTNPTPAQINRWYEPKEQLTQNRQFVHDNQKETLAQVFTDVRYTRTNNEHFSKILLQALICQGFLDPLPA